jgi:hypothetical protein
VVDLGKGTPLEFTPLLTLPRRPLLHPVLRCELPAASALRSALRQIYLIIARRVRVTFAAFIEAWAAKHLMRGTGVDRQALPEILEHQLLKANSDRLLSAITARR